MSYLFASPTLFADRSASERKRLYHYVCIPVRLLIAGAALSLVAWAKTGGAAIVAVVALLASIIGFGRWRYVRKENKRKIWWSRRYHASVAIIVLIVALWALADPPRRLAAGITIGGILFIDVTGGFAYSLSHADWNISRPPGVNILAENL